LIELEPAKPTFTRVWVTEGFDDFRRAADLFEKAHAGCGVRYKWFFGPHSTTHLDVTERTSPIDGIRRVWFYCVCGRQRLAFGPPDGRPMAPPFARVQ